MSAIENLFFEDNLVTNLKLASYFILLYEHFEDVVISTVKEFYSAPVIMDGKLFETLDNSYISALKKVQAGEKSVFIPYDLELRDAVKSKESYEREVIGSISQNETGEIKDGKAFRGSLCWLQKYGVFTDSERKRILSIRARRNTLVHELFQELNKGLASQDTIMVSELLIFHDRVNNWRFQQVEMPIMEIELPEGTNPEDVISGSDATLQSMFRILFCNEGEAFKEAYEQLTGNVVPDNRTGGKENANS